MSKVKVYWPSWRYHESCPEGRIFNAAEDVPDGWVDHPAKMSGVAPAAAPPAAPAPKTRMSKEDKRLALLAEARAKFGDIVPETATVAELEAALNGNGS